ncbi:pyridoxal phosphate-dependent aminotransferase [Micromonospora sp. NPDC092111]|uniref:pyridoxal phosphate-dependent aminotransferase n=1 Tax=Micromonospora sp. NPDC092111 TaxID=3364289 RepID=UPI00380EEBA9
MGDPFFRRTLELLAGPGSSYARSVDAPLMLDLSVGEVRYPLPAAMRAEIGAAVAESGPFWYGDPAGEEVLRVAYLHHLARVGDVDRAVLDPWRVLVTAGGKEAAWLAVRYLLHRRPGGVLVPQPGWEPYRLWATAAGHPLAPYNPATVAADPALLRQIVAEAAPRPTVLIVNYPHNPTGVAVDQAVMDQLVAVAAACDLAVMSDEVYRTFAPDAVSALFAPAFDLARDIVVDSCSKWLSVAGLRVGFLVADPATIRDLTRFRSLYASCTSVLSQRVAATLLGSDVAARWLSNTRADIHRTRADTVTALAGLGVPVISHGGLYAWCRVPDREGLPDLGRDGAARITPGDGFGAPGHLRLCTARADLDPSTAAAAVVTTLRGC